MTRSIVVVLAQVVVFQDSFCSAIGVGEAALTVVTTTEDLASLTREVGGDRVSVEALGRGYQNPHFVEAKPSLILKLNRADLLVAVGRDLEIGWLPPLVRQSRNARIQVGASGYLDASLRARVLDIPTGQVTRAMGDMHALGNPHYWLDPDNGWLVAQAISAKLIELSPSDEAYIEQRTSDFGRRLTEAQQRWEATMAPYRGLQVVTYHRTWSNFAERFGLDVIGYVEPRPGIPPLGGPHAHADPGDAAPGRRDYSRGALLRSQNAPEHRPGDRGRGGRAAAVGWRRRRGDRLLQAIRLQPETPRRGRQSIRALNGHARRLDGGGGCISWPPGVLQRHTRRPSRLSTIRRPCAAWSLVDINIDA